MLKCPSRHTSSMYTYIFQKTSTSKYKISNTLWLKCERKKNFNIFFFFLAWSIKLTLNPTGKKKPKTTEINIRTWISCLCRWYLWVLVAKEKKITHKHHSQFKKIYNLSSGTWRHFQFSRIWQIYGFGVSFPLPTMYIKDICWQTLPEPHWDCQWTTKMS